MITRFVFVISIIFVVAACTTIFTLMTSLSPKSGIEWSKEIDSHIVIEVDSQGVPTISSDSRKETAYGLGFLTARDRMFQMDLMRRRVSGRLAEIFGPSLAAFDRKQRALGFKRVAREISKRLPLEQLEVIQAYTRGVNHFNRRMNVRQIEFILLDYFPDPWTVDDCILVELGMFQTLTDSSPDERMMTTMRSALPDDLISFLTPKFDKYSTSISGQPISKDIGAVIPIKALESVRARVEKNYDSKGKEIFWENDLVGSNCWAVDGSKTRDGRAIVSNDIHMRPTVPNIWYRVNMRHGTASVSGVVVPGIPVVIAGSNNYVAWGVANAMSDVIDLVQLEINPENPAEYKTPDGWQRFETVSEKIIVRGSEDIEETFRSTIWGPVKPYPHLGRLTAVHWTALDADAVDFGLMEMDRAMNMEAALGVVRQFRGPPLSFVLADNQGTIASTICGMIPNRYGFDGSSSVSWANGRAGWAGYVKQDMLPVKQDPHSGFLVAANNRMYDEDVPLLLGHNFGNSYRAHRIAERLSGMTMVDEESMFRLQLDNVSHFFEFYRNLALEVLTDQVVEAENRKMGLRNIIAAWDGSADENSVAFGVLVQFRRRLIADVFEPIIQRCRKFDDRFEYVWWNKETPLRMLLAQQIPRTLPNPLRYTSWRKLIIASLEKSVEASCKNCVSPMLELKTWKEINVVPITHPLSGGVPFAKLSGVKHLSLLATIISPVLLL